MRQRYTECFAPQIHGRIEFNPSPILAIENELGTFKHLLGAFNRNQGRSSFCGNRFPDEGNPSMTSELTHHPSPPTPPHRPTIRVRLRPARRPPARRERHRPAGGIPRPVALELADVSRFTRRTTTFSRHADLTRTCSVISPRQLPPQPAPRLPAEQHVVQHVGVAEDQLLVGFRRGETSEQELVALPDLET